MIRVPSSAYRLRCPSPRRRPSRGLALLQPVWLATAAALAGGCAAIAPAANPGGEPYAIAGPGSVCERDFASVRQAVADAAVGDAEARPIPGFPYLRINRFLAYLGERFRGKAYGPAFEAWVDRLQDLDSEATRIEVANLPADTFDDLRSRLEGRPVDRGDVAARMSECARRMRERQLAQSTARRDLVALARVSDNYSELARAAGLFPLTSIPIQAGWENWKREHLGTFQLPIADLPVEGKVRDFVPAGPQARWTPSRVRRRVEASRDALLGIPEPRGDERKWLIRAFAPVWRIDVAGGYDLFGVPKWHPDGKSIVIDHQRPTVFTRISHTVVGNEVLLQLNYAIWFQERPSKGTFDTLGGNLDGVIWRVTLGADGRPLVYDSIHACGCYHLVFPVGALKSRHVGSRAPALREKPAILAVAPEPKPRQRIVLRLATASHYLVGVSARRPENRKIPKQFYQFREDRKLRSIPLPRTGRKSLYREDGIVAGTERLERFLLWPAGVRSPGAMRQWGHHATAFVDRRHFDDPDLIESLLGQ